MTAVPLQLQRMNNAGSLRGGTGSIHRDVSGRIRRASCTRVLSYNTVSAPKTLTIIHFNDVYDIGARGTEPVGGAARFTQAVRSFASQQPLILFSGDCLNPSLLSAFTKGEQMVPILNGIGVHAAALGNHDFDFGVDVIQGYMESSFSFPWLLSNVLDPETGKPLAGAHQKLLLEWQGVKVGLLGLVEPEWLLTIPSIDAQSDITYLNFIDQGKQLAKSLLDDGADVIVALTHMRRPNDELLAAAVPEIHLILGGHDHEYFAAETQPHGTLLVKSGTDFRDFSVLTLSKNIGQNAPLSIACKRVSITSDIPEAKDVAAIVAQYQSLMGSHMDQHLGFSFVDLDARFDAVRSRETNVGNLFADIMRLGLGTDIAFLNGGTIRSDQIHPAGRLCMRDFVAMLPFTDELVVLQLTGKQLLQALETGVSAWPKREGRFLQVSGVKFSFNPVRPPGFRVIKDSVMIGGRRYEEDRDYTVATKAYLCSGKDGFDALRGGMVKVDGETSPRLATLVHYLLSRIETLNTTENNHMGMVNKVQCAHGLDALYYWDATSRSFGVAPKVEGRIVNICSTPFAMSTMAGNSVEEQHDHSANIIT